MSQPWIKVWQEKILSSMNLRQCNFTSHSLFLEFLIRVRPDGEWAGQLCYPDGRPIPDEELWNDIKMKARDYRNAKKRLLELNIIFVNKQGCICLRKFNDLQMATHETKSGQSSGTKSGHSSGTKSGQSRDNGKHNLTLQKRTDIEEKRRDIDNIAPVPTGPVAVVTPIKPKRALFDPDKAYQDYCSQDLLGYFCNQYEKIYKIRYMCNFGKDGKIFKELLALYKDPTMVVDAVDIFFEEASKEGSWIADKVTIGVFKTQINKIMIKLREDLIHANKKGSV